MLRQIEWAVQNEPITKNGVLPVTNYLIVWKILFHFKNLLQRVDLIYQLPNAHIHRFCNSWSSIWDKYFRSIQEWTK